MHFFFVRVAKESHQCEDFALSQSNLLIFNLHILGSQPLSIGAQQLLLGHILVPGLVVVSALIGLWLEILNGTLFVQAGVVLDCIHHLPRVGQFVGLAGRAVGLRLVHVERVQDVWLPVRGLLVLHLVDHRSLLKWLVEIIVVKIIGDKSDILVYRVLIHSRHSKRRPVVLIGAGHLTLFALDGHDELVEEIGLRRHRRVLSCLLNLHVFLLLKHGGIDSFTLSHRRAHL